MCALSPLSGSMDADVQSSATKVELTEILQRPGQVGSEVLRLADIAACLSAERFSHRSCVTVAVDSCIFASDLGDLPADTVMVFIASVNRAWNTSCEVGVIVFAERAGDQGSVEREKLWHVLRGDAVLLRLSDHLTARRTSRLSPSTRRASGRNYQHSCRPMRLHGVVTPKQTSGVKCGASLSCRALHCVCR